MGIVIKVKFRKRFPMRQARGVLGREYFFKALREWTLEELKRTAEGCWMNFEAQDAYMAVWRFRAMREAPSAPCTVVEFPMRKAA